MKRLDFEYFERVACQENLMNVRQEVQQRAPRLRKRILHFSELFGIPEQSYWDALEVDPSGPLASTLAREARRQNIHEKEAAKYVSELDFVANFEKLKASGPNALYLNRDGQLQTGDQLKNVRKPSKSLDFRWITNGLHCLAAQKYTKEGGGNQDSQFNELVQLLQNYAVRTNNGVALFILVDGAYYNEARLAKLFGLVRTKPPKSYVTSVNSLQDVLREIVAAS